MMLLAIDTASRLCAACIYDADNQRELGRSVLDIGKGHAEHLMTVISEALGAAGVGYADLGRVAVNIGPGSFTGVRVGVSAARGFALALGIPAIGVNALEGLAAEARRRFGPSTVLAALDAGRGEINAAVYDELAIPVYGPAVTTLDHAAGLARQYRPVLAGSAAAAIRDAAASDLLVFAPEAPPDILAYAKLGAGKHFGSGPPRPLYLRAADAEPQLGFALPRAGA